MRVGSSNPRQLVPIGRAEPVAHSHEVIHCHVNREHSVRMEFMPSVYGTRSGEIVAWCYDCRRAVPPESHMPVVSREVNNAPIPRVRGEHRRFKERNQAIRKAMSRGESPLRLAQRYSLTTERIHQIAKRVPE